MRMAGEPLSRPPSARMHGNLSAQLSPLMCARDFEECTRDLVIGPSGRRGALNQFLDSRFQRALAMKPAIWMISRTAWFRNRDLRSLHSRPGAFARLLQPHEAYELGCQWSALGISLDAVNKLFQ